MRGQREAREHEEGSGEREEKTENEKRGDLGERLDEFNESSHSLKIATTPIRTIRNRFASIWSQRETGG